MGRSGADRGQENAQRLGAYIEDRKSGDGTFPVYNGRLNRSAIAKACGFDRAVFAQNPACKELIENLERELSEYGLLGKQRGSTTEQKLRQRVLTLEQQVANLRAENEQLRRELRRHDFAEELMVETGRKVRL